MALIRSEAGMGDSDGGDTVTEEWRNQVLEGDALTILKEIPDGCACIICDPPYGTTASKRDNAIDPDKLWPELMRVSKRGRGVIFTSIQPYSSRLIMANETWFKWADVWAKSHATGHLNCKVMPLRAHEDILVFGNGKILYQPSITPKAEKDVRKRTRRGGSACYGAYEANSPPTICLDETYPKSIIYFNSPNHGEKGYHEHQKPLALMKYLISTYTAEGDIVLDFACGSGTTAIAAAQLNRKWVAIDKDPACCVMARERIVRETAQMNMFHGLAAKKTH